MNAFQVASRAARIGALTALVGVGVVTIPVRAADAPSAAQPPGDLEPAVNTSAPSPVPSRAQQAAPARSPSTSAPPSAAPSASSAASAVPGAAPPASRAAPAATNAAPAAATSTAASASGGAPRGKVMDRLNLDETQVTGNSELPKVLYIVPWKRADLGDLNGKPMNSLLDEVLTPIDRDVFRRENRYYGALEAAQGGAPGAKAAPAAQGTRDEK